MREGGFRVYSCGVGARGDKGCWGRVVRVRVVGEARVRFHVGSCVGFFRISF